jgi:hypothetical protein
MPLRSLMNLFAGLKRKSQRWCRGENRAVARFCGQTVWEGTGGQGKRPSWSSNTVRRTKQLRKAIWRDVSLRAGRHGQLLRRSRI